MHPSPQEPPRAARTRLGGAVAIRAAAERTTPPFVAVRLAVVAEAGQNRVHRGTSRALCCHECCGRPSRSRQAPRPGCLGCRPPVQSKGKEEHTLTSHRALEEDGQEPRARPWAGLAWGRAAWPTRGSEARGSSCPLELCAICVSLCGPVGGDLGPQSPGRIGTCGACGCPRNGSPESRGRRATPGAPQGSVETDVPVRGEGGCIRAAGGRHAVPEAPPCSEAVFTGDVGESFGRSSVPRGGFAAAFTDERLKHPRAPFTLQGTPSTASSRRGTSRAQPSSRRGTSSSTPTSRATRGSSRATVREAPAAPVPGRAAELQGRPRSRAAAGGARRAAAVSASLRPEPGWFGSLLCPERPSVSPGHLALGSGLGRFLGVRLACGFWRGDHRGGGSPFHYLPSA